jgi:hypothetical protein
MRRWDEGLCAHIDVDLNTHHAVCSSQLCAKLCGSTMSMLENGPLLEFKDGAQVRVKAKD